MRGVVPPGFAYFDVAFGLQEGFAHVVENEAEWKAEFGRDVLEGLLDHPDAGTPPRAPNLSPSPSPRPNPDADPHPDLTLTPTLSPTLTPTLSPTLSPTLTPTRHPARTPQEAERRGVEKRGGRAHQALRAL